MREKLLVVGASDMDLSLPILSIPHAGDTQQEDGRYLFGAGGNGAVASLALSQLGASVLFSSRLGGDNHGSRLLALFRKAEIDTRYVAVDDRRQTGLRIALQETNGNCRVMYYPGANRALAAPDIELAMNEGMPDALYLSMELNEDLLLSVLRMAQNRRLPVYLDATGINASHFPYSSLSPVEIFSANDRETMAITGVFPAGSDSCLKACVELEKRIRARYYLLRLGERGVFLYDGKYCNVFPPFGVRFPDDTPLCDTFSAVALLAYLRTGRDISAACKYGLALNGLLLKNTKDPTYFPSYQEIQAFAERY